VANFRSVASGLSNYADTVDGINEEILSIAEQILAASAVGAVLTFVTAGISDAVAAAADAANGGLDAFGTVLTEGALGEAVPGLADRSMAMAGLANVGGGIFQSEAGGLFHVNGDNTFQDPLTGAGLSADVQNLEGAAADGAGGAYAHDGDTAKNGQDGAMPVGQ